MRIRHIIEYTWFIMISLFIRPIIKIIGHPYRKYKWNEGLCKRCDGKWFLDAYDSDNIWIHKYHCDKCTNTLYSTTHLEELKDDEAKAKRRENKLKNIGL